MKYRWATPVWTKVRPGFRKPRVMGASLTFSIIVTLCFLTGYAPVSFVQSVSHDNDCEFNKRGCLRVKGHAFTAGKTQQEKPCFMEWVDFSPGEAIMGNLRSLLVTPHGNDDAVSREVARDLLAQLEHERLIMARTPSLCPAGGIYTSRFGWRYSPFTGDRVFHKGIDIAALDESPVYASADGVVISYRRCSSFGNVMEVDHGSGVTTLYGHLKKPEVKIGKQVKKGDKIAYLGDSGRTTGSHLHYEIIVRGVNVNPQRYMLK